MNSNIIGWLSVLGAGAASASAAVAAGPLDKRTAIIAVCAFFVGAGAAAKALYTVKPGADKIPL